MTGLLHMPPATARHDIADRRNADTEAGSKFTHVGLATPSVACRVVLTSDYPDLVRIKDSVPTLRTLGLASSLQLVGDVQVVVSQVEVPDVDAAFFALVTGVEDVEVSGVSVGENPHDAGDVHRFALEGRRGPRGVVRQEDAFIRRGLRSLFGCGKDVLAVQTHGSAIRALSAVVPGPVVTRLAPGLRVLATGATVAVSENHRALGAVVSRAAVALPAVRIGTLVFPGPRRARSAPSSDSALRCTRTGRLVGEHHGTRLQGGALTSVSPAVRVCFAVVPGPSPADPAPTRADVLLGSLAVGPVGKDNGARRVAHVDSYSVGHAPGRYQPSRGFIAPIVSAFSQVRAAFYPVGCRLMRESGRRR